MLILSRPKLEIHALVKTCQPSSTGLTEIPVINLKVPEAKNQIVDACQRFGFFKLTNHGVCNELMNTLEDEVIKFFNLTQSEKDKAGPSYGNKEIGQNGDMGWLDYLLFKTNPQMLSQKPLSIYQENQEIFWCALEEYIRAMRNMSCEILELIAEGLRIGPKDVLSKMLKDERSDSILRVNHYPPNPELSLFSNKNNIGFGEHTDPQIISILRSNNTSGLQISLSDGSWVPVPPDPNSFFVNVDDLLQIMTNGKFRSVKHRVVCDNWNSRLSIIFFGGPPLEEKIAPLSSLIQEGDRILYKEFTWSEYKRSAIQSRLSDNRLKLFEKD